MAATGARGVKIKLGGRMRNTPDDDRRTRALVPVIRRRLGDATTIYAGRQRLLHGRRRHRDRQIAGGPPESS